MYRTAQDPYLKIFTSGCPGIRVDHAANVVVLDPDIEAEVEVGWSAGLMDDHCPWWLREVPGRVARAAWQEGAEGNRAGVMALEEEGRRCLYEGNLEGALRAYNRALGLRPTHDVMVTMQHVTCPWGTLQHTPARWLVRVHVWSKH
jgi:hypothetical protein